MDLDKLRRDTPAVANCNFLLSAPACGAGSPNWMAFACSISAGGARPS
jgi:hypothetical protein